MSKPIIATDGLTKRFRFYRKRPGLTGALETFVKRTYEEKVAVYPFSCRIERGEIVGLLSPNGAGKTTLMKMLSGIVAPSGGTALVAGEVPFSRTIPFRKHIALVMGQKSQLWWDIPAADSFRLLQRYYEVPDKEAKKRLLELTALLEVEHVLHVALRKLSLGERMKMELIGCLLHQPQVLFLDEPTIGLDIVAQQNVRAFLREYQSKQETTIILTSHYMADVAALCSRVILIAQGEKYFDDTVHAFSKAFGSEKLVEVVFAHAVDRSEPFWQPLQPTWSDQTPERVTLRIPEPQLRETFAHVLDRYPVVDFRTEDLPIERVMEEFMRSPQSLKGDNSA